MTDKTIHFPPPQKIALIGSASGWGAQRGGTEDGADKVMASLAAFMPPDLAPLFHWYGTAYAPMKRFLRDSDDDSLIREHIITQIQFLNILLGKVLCSEHFPVVIGGDHACALGTWSSVISHTQTYTAAEFGLIWLDAHMDANTPETSPSNRYHGMPVAALLGKGHPDFVNAITPGGGLFPQNIVLVGVRSFDPEEAAFLQSLGVRIYFDDEVNNRGLDAVLQEINGTLINAVSHYGISLDLDVFDPLHIPGIGSPEPGGILPEVFIQTMHHMLNPQKLSCFEIMEYNPHMDDGDKTCTWILRILAQFAEITRTYR